MPHTHISLIHPTGNPNSRQAALALSEVGLLQEIITTIAYNPDSFSQYLNLLPKQISNIVIQELGRRTWIAPQNVSMQTHPWLEIRRLLLVKTGLNKCLNFSYQELVDLVYLSLDNHVAKHHLQGINGIYAYEDGAATTFQKAKQQGIICLYELPIVFYRTSLAIQLEEAELFSELAPALQSTQEPARKLERKEQEIQLADHIFVPSSFVQDSLLAVGIKPEKISVIPFGAPIEYFRPKPKIDNLFRALFVGRVSPRKGVHYLLKAWQQLQLPDSELLLVGINDFPEGWLNQYTDIIRYLKSVPHSSLNQYYSAASVLVFPSLVEGLALVQLEAMACGIPIITTSNAGGSDIVTDGVEGFVIPIRDLEALKEKLEWCYRHPQELAAMGRAARQKAEQLTWKQYRYKLATKVQELINCGKFS